jgi:hypothetical protein
MDQIRPIGPVERDIDPIVRITRTDPDARRERDEQQPEPRKEPPREPSPPIQQPNPDDDGGSSLIDVRV